MPIIGLCDNIENYSFAISSNISLALLDKYAKSPLSIRIPTAR